MNDRWRPFSEYGPTIRVEGGLKARSTRGAIGETWWSKRFLAVLESFALGTRLSRGRRYARAGQVLTLEVGPGAVSAVVQGSRPTPYDVSVHLPTYDDETWSRIEAALAEQALFSARLLAGEMPREIEEVFAAAGAPLFPAGVGELSMRCSCPDWQVPCKHIAATFYLLAEAFDADPFQILAWRGRDRATLLEDLRALRSAEPELPGRRPARGRAARGPAAGPRRGTPARRGEPKRRGEPARLGAAAAVAEVASPRLAETVDRFWVPPVPLPARPPTLDTDVDLLLRQLPTPPPSLGGVELAERLRAYYAAMRPSE